MPKKEIRGKILNELNKRDGMNSMNDMNHGQHEWHGGMDDMNNMNGMNGTEDKGSKECRNDIGGNSNMKGMDKMEDMNGMDTMESVGEDGVESLEGIESLDSGDEELDRLLKQAFEKMVAEDYAKRPQEFPKHQFSARFERNMEKLLCAAETPTEEPAAKFSLLELLRPIRSKKAVVVMAAIMVLVFGMTAGGTNPIIIWLHDNWMQQHGDYVEVQNREDKAGVSEEVFHKYELAEIPKGYRVVDEEFDEDVGVYMITYVDKNGNMLIVQQSKKDNGNIGNLTAGRKDINRIEVGDFEGYYVDDLDMSNLVLCDKEYMVVITGYLSRDEFLKLAENLQVAE